MKIIMFLTIALPIYITFRLILRIIYGLIHYEKKIYAILVLMLVSFIIVPLREYLFTNPYIIFFILSLSFICEVILLILNYITFKIRKNKGYYHEISATVMNTERRFEFVKHNFVFFGMYFFPQVSYEMNNETCYYSLKNGYKEQIYKIGDSINLYIDPSTGEIIEEKGKNNNIILAFQLLFIGLYFLYVAFGII